MNRDVSPVRLSLTQFLLLLHCVPYLGEKSLGRILRLQTLLRFTPEDCLALTPDQWVCMLQTDARVADWIADNRSALLERSAEQLRVIQTHGIYMLTAESAAYPRMLERFDDAPPPVLYALGSCALLEIATAGRFRFTVAVSNGASSESLARMEEIATALVQAGGIPVTGHDRTPYKRLALCAQRLNRPVLYLLDRGLREALGPRFDRPPFSAARIRDAVFDAKRDLALSPFRLDDHAIGANNRRRDSLICAMADLIVAADVRAGGAMMETCLRANRLQRPVFVAGGGREGNALLREAGCSPAPESWTETLQRTFSALSSEKEASDGPQAPSG